MSIRIKQFIVAVGLLSVFKTDNCVQIHTKGSASTILSRPLLTVCSVTGFLISTLGRLPGYVILLLYLKELFSNVVKANTC